MEKINYQKTLNLPKTSFAMKAGLTQKEPLMLSQWQKQGLYKDLRAKSKGKKTFILHDGPPYANGHIHIGHVLNKVLKDFVVKMKTMQGLDSLYVPGWDCHGLPIEHQLFKKLKKRKSDVDTVAFRKEAHDYALTFVDIQKEEFIRLGILGEWDRPYLTLSREYEYWILKSFGRLVKEGYVYRGLKPVNWCADCETALAEAEVEYEDHTSPSVFVRFVVTNPQKLPGVPDGKAVHLCIWTTTPWTLLANVAVAVHPQFDYVLIERAEEILVMEESLHKALLEKVDVNGQVIKKVNGAALTGLVYSHPFARLESCRVVTADYVTKEEGTGLVHTAPGHGQEDYETGLKYGLPVLMPVNDRGVFTEEGGPFAGQHVFKANDHIVADLKARGLLILSENVAHSYPHCWRCKKPIIFRATKQWFLKIDHKDLRQKLINNIQDKVTWIPGSGQERIASMVALRPDWCLSRQRHWGVPIPALICQGCQGEHKLYTEVIDRFMDIVRQDGSDAWFSKEIKDIVPKGFVCPDCGGNTFEKTSDILDVWFDSGVSHQAVVKPMMNMDLPVDLYLEGSDQHRGWFQSSLIPSVALDQQAPYKAVLTHGFVVDGDGRKMSKSLGNVIAPQDIIKHNGVDILRMWVASSNYNDDIRLSQEIIDRLVDAYRKIRNTVRYLLGNIYDFDPDADALPYAQMLEVDQWALFQLQRLIGDVQGAYNRYEFAKVYKLIYSFCNEELSGFYLDILKDRLYTSSSISKQRRSAQTVLFYMVNHLVRLLAPIIPFTADEIFLAMPKAKEFADCPSVHLLEWLSIPAEWKNEKVHELFGPFLELRPFVLKALEDKRRVGEIGSPLEAKVVFQTASQRDGEYLNKLKDMLPALLVVSQVDISMQATMTQGLGEMFPQTNVEIRKADGQKCPRCWNFADIGSDQEYKDLCPRCVTAVKENLKRV